MYVVPPARAHAADRRSMSAESSPLPAAEPIRIPTLPTSVERVRETLARPDVSIEDIVEAFHSDPPLTARVLGIANSAYYGRREKTISLQAALSFLGLRTLSMVVLRAGVLAAFAELKSSERATIEAIWKHSILTGRISEELALHVRRRTADLSAQDHHTCGLLHDVGKIILYDNFGEQYADVLRRSPVQGEALEIEEQKALGLRHSEVGHMAAAFWKIPEPIPSMIRNLHRKTAARDLYEMTVTVRCADEIANAVARHPSGAPKAIRAELETALVGLRDDHLLEVISIASASWRQLEL
jgi:HD-like signal output (HDOD) protein